MSQSSLVESAEYDRSVRVYVAGAAVLAVAMGFGRFAYTPLLAVMRHDAGLSVPFAGVLASVNLAGYLCGALVATQPAVRAHRKGALCVASGLVIVTTVGMCLPSQWWSVARFSTGLASGVVFVVAVSLMLDRSARLPSRWGLSILFAGVGVGIAVPALVVPVFAAHGGSHAAWIGIDIIGGVILLLALPQIPDEPRPKIMESARALGDREQRRKPLSDAFWWLSVAYGLEGAAYIIPATFLVAMVTETPSLTRAATFAWAFVGLAAAPGAMIWNAVSRRIGKREAFVVAMFSQALALLCPRVVPGLAGVLLAAVGLGTTFVGITFLTSAVARELRPLGTNMAIGVLTVIYGVGQIIGPLVAVRIYVVSGKYEDALAAAAAMAAFGAVLFGANIVHGRLHPAIATTR